MAEGRDDPLAYGDSYERPSGTGDDEYEGGERGIIGDTFRRIRGKPPRQSQTAYASNQDVTQSYQPQIYNQSSAPSNYTPSQASQGSSGLASIFDKVHGLGSELKQKLEGKDDSKSHYRPGAAFDHAHDAFEHRYDSFAGTRTGDCKWYVDGCGYMWAVSKALEQAKKSIWILDCQRDLLSRR